ncbi:MAG: V-type ATP synthase subunit B, partial [Oscillospiraceae bacterium]|nr:V-type ATP synthase subunit B [Oscillospiraceae bacterium]
VIGEDELSENDRAYMAFGRLFEDNFLNQGFDENRSMNDTLELGWDLLCSLPRNELDRIDDKLLEEKYDPKRAERFSKVVDEQAE